MRNVNYENVNISYKAQVIGLCFRKCSVGNRLYNCALKGV